MGFDEQIFHHQSRGGISRYVTRLVDQFHREKVLGVAPVLGWRYAPNAHAEEVGLSGRIPNWVRPTGLQARLTYLMNTRARSRLRGVSMVHHTFYDPRWLRTAPGALRVVTIHDMIPELLPGMFSSNPHMAKQEYVRRADLILCVSETTRRDLLEVAGPLDAPVAVTSLGVEPTFTPEGPKATRLPEPFVLYVGSRMSYKDFSVLARAFSAVRKRYRALVVVGGGPFSPEEQAELRKLSIEDRVLRFDASDHDLRTVYRSASLFVFPSRYEGFGLPTLEAMASGCPVVAADAPAHREVGATAAEFFPAGDAEALGAILDRLGEDDDQRQALRTAGLRQAERFTWSRTARETADAYRRLVS